MAIDTQKYNEFVNAVTSDESKVYLAFEKRVFDLEKDVSVERLLTAALGLCAESGEFTEVVKKTSFINLPPDDSLNNEHQILLQDISSLIYQHSSL